MEDAMNSRMMEIARNKVGKSVRTKAPGHTYGGQLLMIKQIGTYTKKVNVDCDIPRQAYKIW